VWINAARIGLSGGEGNGANGRGWDTSANEGDQSISGPFALAFIDRGNQMRKN
jgi:hypothetical protein